MNKSIWRKALLTDFLMSFGVGIVFVLVPALVLKGAGALAVLLVPLVIVTSFMFIVGIPLYLHVFKSEWNRHHRE